MMDHEFSSPRAEFSPPRQEFAPPRPEFTPPKGEQHAPGAEFAQSAAVPEQKKRRVNPLMLTAAAVASSAIILTPVSVSVRPSGPSLQLNADQRAYMSELSAALDAHDKDWLIELAHDPRTMELIEFFIAESETSGEDYGYYENIPGSVIYGDGTINYDAPHYFSDFFYNEALGLAYPHSYSLTDEDTVSYSLSYSDNQQSPYDSPDYSIFFCRIADGKKTSSMPHQEQSLSASFYIGESMPIYCRIIDMTVRWDETSHISIPIEGTSHISLHYFDSSGRSSGEADNLTMTGTYAYDPEKGEDYLPDSARYYLENGTAISSYNRRGIQTDISFEVKNGQTIDDGQFLIDSQQYIDGLKYFITTENQIPCPLIEDGDSVDDLLFHTFRYEW